LENSYSVINSSNSVNSIRKNEKSLSNSNDNSSDNDIDQDEFMFKNEINFERLAKIEKNNLSIICDNFDEMIGLD